MIRKSIYSVLACVLLTSAHAQKAAPLEEYTLTKNKTLKHAVAENASPTDIAFSPDGKWLASTHENGFVWLYDIASNEAKPLVKASADNRIPICLAFSPDSKEIAIGMSGGERDATISRISLAKGAAKIPDITIPSDLDEEDGETYPSTISSIAYQPGEAKLIATSTANKIHLWDRKSNKEVAEVLPAKDVFGIDAKFTPDGKKLVSCGSEFVLRIFSVPDLKQISELKTPGEDKIDSLEKFSMSADGSTVATAGMSYLQAWDLKTGKSTYLLEGTEEKDNEYFSSRTALSPDGSVIVSEDGNILLFFTAADPEDCIDFEFDAHPEGSSIREIAFSDSGKHLASADKNGLIILWSTPPPAPKK